MLGTYTSVLEFVQQRGLRQQGFHGVLALKTPQVSPGDWLICFPGGDAFWNGQLLAARMVPMIQWDKLFMPLEPLESVFGSVATASGPLSGPLSGRLAPAAPTLAPPALSPRGTDLLIVGSPEFPREPRIRDGYRAYPVDRLQGPQMVAWDGPLHTLAQPPGDLRPGSIVRLCYAELGRLEPQMTPGHADVLIFRNRAWTVSGSFTVPGGPGGQASQGRQGGQGPGAARGRTLWDFLCLVRVKGHQFQMKLAAAPQPGFDPPGPSSPSSSSPSGSSSSPSGARLRT